MKTVWKFPVKPDFQEIALPVGAEILTVQVQRGEPQLWALVDDAAPMEARTFVVVGTGHPMPEPSGTYVGTFQLPDYGLVFHLFEGPRASLPLLPKARSK